MLKYYRWLEIITSEVNVLLLTVIKKNNSADGQKSAEKICKQIAGENLSMLARLLLYHLQQMDIYNGVVYC